MKAFGQARQIVFFTTARELQHSAEPVRQRRAEILGQQQARHLTGLVENLLGKADVHQQYARRHVGLGMQRWQGLAVGTDRPFALMQPHGPQRLRCDPGAARGREKLDDLLDRQCPPGHRRTRRQRHRFNAHQLQSLLFQSLERHSPLQHRRNRPTRTPQVHKQLLGKCSPARGTETGLGFAPNQFAGPGVTVPRLAVQGLYAREQAGGEPQPGQHAEKLHRVLPPVAQQRA